MLGQGLRSVCEPGHTTRGEDGRAAFRAGGAAIGDGAMPERWIERGLLWATIAVWPSLVLLYAQLPPSIDQRVPPVAG